uniref:Putative dna cross-link repair protein pso2/snm1 n=1 Tax=Schistosoma mansoni TaxID=6183 RepID=A0A5K4ENY8_SCHMA
MFLFYVPSKQRTYLHTGDFRYTPSMLTHPSILTNYISDNSASKKLPRIHSIFLDTTYCSSQYDFPNQVDVIHGALEVTRDYLIKDPTILVVCGMYSIGKERFTLGLASELNLKVWLPNNQNRLIKLAAQGGCSVCKELLQYVVDSSHKAQLHVLPMQQLNVAGLVQYQKKLGNRLPIDPFHNSPTFPKLRSILGWRPTGWSHRQSNNAQSSIRPPPNGIVLEQKKGDIHIYGKFSDGYMFRTRSHFVFF